MLPRTSDTERKTHAYLGQVMHRNVRSLVLVLFAPAVLAIGACSIQRAQTAAAAQTAMVGLSKADVLACMGVPQTNAAEGNVDVWGYQSGNGRTDMVPTHQAERFRDRFEHS